MIKGLNLTNKISFTSKIEFVSLSTYIERKSNSSSVDYPWTINEAISSHRAQTKGISACLAGGITDKNKVFMFHLTPHCNIENFSQVRQKLQEQIVASRKAGKNPRAFIIGGVSFIKSSEDLLEKLTDVFKKMNIDYSYIFGQKSGCSSVYYNAKNDTWSIVTSNKAFTSEQMNALDSFTKIKISSQDQLSVGEQKVALTFVNKLKNILVTYHRKGSNILRKLLSAF